MAKKSRRRLRRRSQWILSRNECIQRINQIPFKYWPLVKELRKQGINNERLLSYFYGKGYLPSYSLR